MKSRRLCAAALALLLGSLAAGCAGRGGSEVGPGVTYVDGVMLLDGRGGPPVGPAHVRIEGDRIAAVGQSAAPRLRGAVYVDGRGGWLLPGFIDMHAHLLAPRCGAGPGAAPRFDREMSLRGLSVMLDFGITTVRSPATPTVDGLALRDALNRGAVRGPQAFASAELIDDRRAGPDEIRAIVRAALPHRPDYFKAYAGLDPQAVAALVDEAHRNGIPVIGHLQRTSWREGIALGIDQLTHAVDWSEDMLPEAARPAFREARGRRPGFASRIDWLEAFDPSDPAVDSLIAELARRRIPVDPTLVAYDAKFSAPDSPRYRRNPHVALVEDQLADWRACGADPTGGWTDEDYRRWRAAWPRLLALVRRYHEAGVLLVAGSDYTNPWVIAGESLHQEFELLAQAGIPNAAILAMAGANAAEALGSEDRGVIAPGRRADLVLLRADPLADISHMRAIEWVMQGGRIVSSGPPAPRPAPAISSPGRPRY